MAKTLLIRLTHALSWAHTQRRSFYVRDAQIKMTLYCDGREEPVSGLQLISMLVEAIERDMPGNTGPCMVCKSDPCICDIPF